MLESHRELATALGIEQWPEESDFDFRKRVFLEVYPEDGLNGIEILFCVEEYSDLRPKDLIFISVAREASEQGLSGLKKFVNGFSSDPAIPYLK